MKLQLIRSATIKLYYENTVLLIDPYFADKFSRDPYRGISRNPLIDLPFDIDTILNDVDGVIVSHLHTDHYDTAAKKTIPLNMPMFCQPIDEQKIRNDGFTNVSPIAEKIFLKDIEITRFPGQHGYDEVLVTMGHVSGFIFRTNNSPSLCWLGDTVLNSAIETMLIKEKPDVVVVHSSGAVWGDNVKILCDEEQTVRICSLLPQSRIIATHMDSLDHGTVSRKRLREYSEEKLITGSRLIIPEDGEIVDL